MTGPIATTQNVPLDPDAYRHQLLLLKSMHCARPVLYQGLNEFIQCITLNLSGSQIDATVHLHGVMGGIDGKEIQIKTIPNEGNEK